ncbi:YqaE/Pmp3 family membrane protein [Methylobacterium variabile]|uniref:YqaE/Pmp3 family membrane protein n=1 Tax=Methylobacterium variabile TaxID=298794 RepID=UPI001FD85231|nr:YqaE/Pmp3 family membrane protein [Methylobacterium variabile]
MGDLIRIILLVVIPPLGVLVTAGFGLQFILNVVLTLFGYLPGLIHAVWVVTRRNY